MADPVSMEYEDHCEVRDEIETLVMKLILDLRHAVPKNRASADKVRGVWSCRALPGNQPSPRVIRHE